MDPELIKENAKKEISEAENLEKLNGVLKKYFGKEGELNSVLKSLLSMPPEERIRLGSQINEVKSFLRNQFDQKASELKKNLEERNGRKEKIDVSVPGKKPRVGTLHPLSRVKKRCEEIFQSMGFEVVEGPEMESEWYNFDALNIPHDHPARDLWDTFYLKNGLLLRTHTSPNQIRYMENHQPPLRIIVPGTVFRHEATDPSHEFQLIQLEGLMIDKKVSAANFKAIIEGFFKRFFNKNIKARLRPDFFPFVEPGFDVSISCVVCGGKGCSVCKKSGWIEVAGAGMVHPNVFKNAGLIPGDWQGWAFGFGIERLAMMKYKINDIRLFRSGDLRFLKQF
ncbi:MAG: phenylalanine--tRNA ligase subunit alpha [Candidatus Pacebacteria bacterium]|nr:phenylalanine--tRNA ligase subunit alpha [Candidatus Paceibacterota bacterium]